LIEIDASASSLQVLTAGCCGKALIDLVGKVIFENDTIDLGDQ